MLASIASDLRRGIVDDTKLEKVKKDPFRYFHLSDAVHARPSALRYTLPIDDHFLHKTERDITRSRNAGKRVGTEWMPHGANTVEHKDTADDHWVTNDELKPLNDVCTKWCTKQYFPDAFSRVNMVANVIRLYDRLRDVTDLRFNIVFKGGVMIRLVLLEFINELPLEARRIVTDYLNDSKALSISDFDFEIVPENHNPKDADVHRLFLLDYAVLLWLQRVMQREIEQGKGGLLSLNWDETAATTELKDYLQREVDELSPDSSLSGAHIDHVFIGDVVPSPPIGYTTKSGKSVPARRKNVLVFDCDDTKCVMPASRAFQEFGVNGVPATSGGSRFYATLNTYIGEDDNEETRPEFLRGVFHLSRIKHAFVVYYTTKDGKRRCDRLGGEMIDLSQSHGIRKDVMKRALYSTIHHPYQEYPILGVRDVVLRSYSVHGFLFDHMTMIHRTEEEPWDVKKKEKRMARYIAFLFAHVFSPDVKGGVVAKTNAMRKLVERTKTLESLLASPLRTGVAPVDEFAARERKSLQNAPKQKGRDYVRVLSRTLQILLECMHMVDDCTSQLVDTSYMSVSHLYRTI